jgi:hypothetical protein
VQKATDYHRRNLIIEYVRASLQKLNLTTRHKGLGFQIQIHTSIMWEKGIQVCILQLCWWCKTTWLTSDFDQHTTSSVRWRLTCWAGSLLCRTFFPPPPVRWLCLHSNWQEEQNPFFFGKSFKVMHNSPTFMLNPKVSCQFCIMFGHSMATFSVVPHLITLLNLWLCYNTTRHATAKNELDIVIYKIYYWHHQ